MNYTASFDFYVYICTRYCCRYFAMFDVNLIFLMIFQQATNINIADHELVYQGRVLNITDELQQLNIVDGSELDLQGTLKLPKT